MGLWTYRPRAETYWGCDGLCRGCVLACCATWRGWVCSKGTAAEIGFEPSVLGVWMGWPPRLGVVGPSEERYC